MSSWRARMSGSVVNCPCPSPAIRCAIRCCRPSRSADPRPRTVARHPRPRGSSTGRCPATALGAGLGPPALEAVPIRQVERLLQHDFKLAAVIGLAAGGAVRHRLGRDHVRRRSSTRSMPVTRARLVDQALDQIDRLGPPGAAVRTERRRIGQHHLDVDVNCGNPVDARQAVLSVVGRDDDGIGRYVGAHADLGAGAQRKKAAVAVERQLARQQSVATVRVGHEAFEPGRAPAHGPAELARGIEHGGVFGIGLHLHAEAAADIERPDPDALGRHLEHRFGQQLAHHRHALGAGDQGVGLLRLVPHPDRGARLERRRRKPGHAQVHRHAMRRRRKRLVDRGGIAMRPVERNVARCARPERRRILGTRKPDPGGRGKLAIADGEAFRGVLRPHRAIRHDDRDGVADMAHAVARQHRH